MRLVGGPSSQEGRLEVYHDGITGTVCGDYFSDAAARVVCTCWDMVTSDTSFLAATVPVVDRFGWTTYSAMERKGTLQIVNTTAGAVTTVIMVKTFLFLASQ